MFMSTNIINSFMTITLIGRDFDLKEKRKHYSVYRIEYFKAHLNVNGLAHGVPLCNDSIPIFASGLVNSWLGLAEKDHDNDATMKR